jgi:hypothetical protein
VTEKAERLIAATKLVAHLSRVAAEMEEFENLTLTTLQDCPIVRLALRTRAGLVAFHDRLRAANADVMCEIKDRQQGGVKWTDCELLFQGVALDLRTVGEQLTLGLG